MKNTNYIIKCVLPVLLFSVIESNAQKLPNIQKSSVRAPAGIKIDRKAKEWNGQFQAYNSATNIFYTISNDDDNLYFSAQAKDPYIINRIVGGGVTLTIKSRRNVSVTYPINDNKYGLLFSLQGRRGIPEDTSVKAADSVMIQHNRILDQKFKLIKVIGIDGMDSLISVYNGEGIKAAGSFDAKKVYTFQFSIKLKYLELSVNDAEKFIYHVQLNGRKAMANLRIATPDGSPVPDAVEQGFRGVVAAQAAPTDFWGYYTLARK